MHSLNPSHSARSSGFAKLAELHNREELYRWRKLASISTFSTQVYWQRKRLKLQIAVRNWRQIFSKPANSRRFAPLAAHSAQPLFPEQSSRPAQSAADSDGETWLRLSSFCAVGACCRASCGQRTQHKDVDMLAIISDLHITDGTTGQLLPPGTMDLLCERLCDLAWRASWRADGSYRPIDRIDLVLLGDVLDIMGSRRWLAVAVPAVGRPSIARRDRRRHRHRRGNPPPQRRLHSHAALAGDRGHRQPAAGHRRAASRCSKPRKCRSPFARTTWWAIAIGRCTCKGTQYDLIRHKVTHHLGLVTPYNKPFPHEACRVRAAARRPPPASRAGPARRHLRSAQLRRRPRRRQPDRRAGDRAGRPLPAARRKRDGRPDVRPPPGPPCARSTRFGRCC